MALKIEDLPAPAPDPGSGMGVDSEVNMSNIDSYLGIEGVAYRDMRMLRDPADFEAMGQYSSLDFTVEGFEEVPYPLIGTLANIPLSNTYDGDRLFDVKWQGFEVLDATPRYKESTEIVEKIFPRESPIIMACSAGGYAAMMRALLVWLGWDPALLYNAGGVGAYRGEHRVDVMRWDPEDADRHSEEPVWTNFDAITIHDIDFDSLTPVG